MTSPSARRPYHHGNLQVELLQAAVRRAQAGGTSAIVIREIARDVGVTSAAVYRHFPDAEHLLAEVSRVARQSLAEALIDARDSVPRRRDPRARAVGRLLATGRAYMRFAVDEPGLFDVAFTACSAPPGGPDDPSAWGVLEGVLDDLVNIGALDPALRPGAALVAWSAVHGLSSILWRGALPPGVDPSAAETEVLQGIVRALRL